MRFEFQELKLKQQGGWLQRKLQSVELKRTIVAVGIGAVLGFAYFYFTEGQRMEIMPVKEIFRSVAVGGFFGFFITNSPCARGRC